MAGEFKVYVLLLCTVINLSSSYVDFKPYNHAKMDLLDWHFFGFLAIRSSENIVISPFSIKVLISVLKEAAAKESRTQEQLTRVLADIASTPKEHATYNFLFESLEEKNSSQYSLDLGTQIYVDKCQKPTQRFMETANSIFRTPLKKINFLKRRKAMREINNWSASVTNGAIEDLVERADIKGNVLLTSAIYFQALWENEFKEASQPMEFTINDQEMVQIPAITLTGQFYFASTGSIADGVDFLRIPYKGKYAMTILRPHKANGLESVIYYIRPGQIRYIQSYLKKMFVKVTLPKFKFETTLHAKKTLELLRITDIFKDSAELPGLGRNAVISDIIQKTKISVDAKGTKRYTSYTKYEDASYWDVKYFTVDHPFAFFIDDEDTGTLLLAGLVRNPIYDM